MSRWLHEFHQWKVKDEKLTSLSVPDYQFSLTMAYMDQAIHESEILDRE